jgi:putative NADH-flavin reductase
MKSRISKPWEDKGQIPGYPEEKENEVIVVVVLVVYAVALTVALARAAVGAGTPVPSPVPGAPVAKVLIVGATGGTGRELVKQALELGLDVTALVRNPSRLSIEHARLRVLAGDVMDYTAVDEAVRGQDAVLSALGHKLYWRPTRILSQGTHHIVRAMETHGVRRLVCETSLGIGSSAGRMGIYYTFFVIPFILAFYFWDKARQERVVAASAVEWVIVRPGALTHAVARGTLRHGPRVGNFLWTVRVARADVARFMLEQAHAPSYLRSAVGVRG